MMKSIRNLSTWRKAALALTACIATLAGVHIAFNTNTFGPDRLCGNLVSAQDVQKAVGHSGRVSDSHPAETPTKYSEFTCSVRLESLLPTQKDTTLYINIGDTSTPDFPFAMANWSSARSDMGYFNGGGASNRSGWTLLPENCWKEGVSKRAAARKISSVWLIGKDGDRQGIARLATATANSAAKQMGCDSRQIPEPTELQLPERARRSNAKATCSLPGFRLPESVTSTTPQPWETFTKEIKSTWVCDLSQEQEKTPFFSFAISQDPALMSSLTQTLDSKDPVGADWKARGQIGKSVASCAGRATFFGMNVYGGGWTAAQREKFFPDDSTLFKEFIRAAGKKLGCNDLAP
ncbi:hypothetical protein [Streptomyces sp. UNOC14_S4]|uniref:hypothetical protein n=1 Tax=Streptomyces sp. UNOC14_S4 TaxID=2872340 RepID=UPI001E2E6D83|nr:hypothetical protein [Streptomyces sp. UNOC14_S4]MCC3766637.1 hypothetical protein [Streptomyces sp. UNOC14_S4]